MTQRVSFDYKQKYKHEEYPQVRKTGVDALHEKAAHRGPTCEKIVICNMCGDDWNIDQRKDGQKDVLQKRTNKKKFSAQA